MLNKKTIVSGLAAVALAGGVVAQTPAPALAHDFYHHRHFYHHDDDAGVAIGAGIFGLAAGAILGGALAPHTVYYDDDYYGPPPVYYYGPPPPVVEGPAYYPPAPAPVRVYETRADHVARCEAYYRSYDPRTDTFMGYDGRPHYCRL